jgi:hypothetical protein
MVRIRPMIAAPSPLNGGEFGQDYLTRSAAAWKYIYINSAAEAMYPTANVDGSGNPLDGTWTPPNVEKMK